MSSNEKATNFVASKPDILIVNRDEEVGITKDFIKYVKENSNVPNVADNEDARNDALFYEDADYIIYIPENFHTEFMKGNTLELEIKRSGDYNSEFAEMLIKRYLSVAQSYKTSFNTEEEIIEKTNETLSKNVEANITSKLDTNSLNRTAFYFNFASYSIMACLIYIICTVLQVFNSEKIRKRTVISSKDFKKHTRELLVANCAYALVVWALYSLAGFVLLGDTMVSKHGALFVVNALIFTINATALSFLIGSIVNNKNAITGIVNVIALGSSFLCGVFVPLEYLPNSVKTMAHVLPTYYYVKTNECISVLENFNSETLQPLINNTLILVGFTAVFITLSIFVAAKKRKIG
jgi:ABC-2 type transport system permease protein